MNHIVLRFFDSNQYRLNFLTTTEKLTVSFKLTSGALMVNYLILTRLCAGLSASSCPSSLKKFLLDLEPGK